MAAPATIELDAQYRQLREESGLADLSERGKLIARGSEAAEYLQGQLTNDIEALAEGEGCYAALLDRKGHIESDARVLRLSHDEIWIDTEAAGLPATLKHLQTYSIGRDAEIADATSERAILSLAGPRSAEIAALPGGEEFSSRALEIGGVAAIATLTGEGVDLICDAGADAERLRAELLERGAAEVSPEAVEILRIEAGRPRFGAEMNTDTLPAEAGIVDRAVSFTKGCYIGQETVARLHYKGRPNRHLRGLRLNDPAEPGTELLIPGGRVVGTLGSACVSPRFGPIGLAIIRREAEPGSTVALDGGAEATVVEVPFGESP